MYWKIRKYLPVFLWCLLIAIIQITICSRSSFLYPMNNWDDSNCFLTMGKGMSNGMVLYRDIYDQKGPFIYILYMLASFVSANSFLGVYLLEVVVTAISLYGFYLIVSLYLEKTISIILIPVISAIIYTSKGFYWGGSAEELILPALIYTLYISLKYFKNDFPNNISNRYVVITGLMAGYILSCKYTVLGLHFAFMMMIALTTLFRKQIKIAFLQSGLFLLSMVVANVPLIIYFGVNGAIIDWIDGYFAMNISNYYGAFAESTSVLHVINNYRKALGDVISNNIIQVVIVVIGVMCYTISTKPKLVEKMNLIALGMFSFVYIYIGYAEFPYYAFPLMIFTVIGVLPIGGYIERLLDKAKFKITDNIKSITNCNMRKFTIILSILSIVVATMYSYLMSMNTHLIGYPEEELYIFQLKEEIEKYIDIDKDTTLLNHGFLDMGLYTVLGSSPNVRFFQGNNMGLQMLKAEQDRYVEEGMVDFVVTLYNENGFDGYTLIKTLVVDDVDLLNYPCPYRLYIRNDLLE